jgi:hypothetical protein
MFHLQLPSFSSGWSSVPGGSNATRSIKAGFGNLALNLAAAAGTIGLAGLTKKAGVSSAYASPVAVNYNASLLTQSPADVSPVSAALGVSSASVGIGMVVIGALLTVGTVALIAYAIKKG